MEPNNAIEQVLHQIHDAYLEGTSETQKSVLNVAEMISNILQGNSGAEDVVIKRLDQIASYAKRRIEEDDVELQNADERILRALRNKFAHGTFSFSTLEQQRRYQKLVWRVITRSAQSWNSYELSNFLSYCLGVQLNFETNVNDVPQGKIVNLYKAAFNVLDNRQKARAVRELLMRISLDSELSKILMKARSGQ